MNYVKFCPYCTLIDFPRYTNEEFEYFKEKKDNLDKCDKISLQREIDYYNDICPDCHNHLENTTILTDEYCKKINYNFNTNYENREIENEEVYEIINKQILNDYIKPLGKIDNTTEEYKENMLWQFNIDLYSIDTATYTPTPPSILMAQQMAQNKPKCPICGSTDLKKLTALDRGVSTFMWGLGSNKIGKTYECRKCKATF